MKLAVTCSTELIIYDVLEGLEVCSIEHPDHLINDFDYSVKNNFLATACQGGAYLWNLETKEIFQTAKHSDVRKVLLTDDYFISAGEGRDHKVTLVRLMGGEGIVIPHQQMVTTISILDNGYLLASGSDDGIVKITDLNDGSLLTTIKCNAPIRDVCMITNELVGIFTYSSTYQIWNIKEKGKKYELQFGRVNSLRYSACKKYFSVALPNGIVEVRTVKNGKVSKIFELVKVEKEFDNGPGLVLTTGAVDAQFNFNSDILVTSCMDKNIRLFSLDSGEQIQKLPMLPGEFACHPQKNSYAAANGTNIDIVNMVPNFLETQQRISVREFVSGKMAFI
ncbi:MAG: hypothetical protein SFY67_01070 [Candidatus Melainabacteria bacterium]|nr:hypothetical protein [Candidatus Melainabacteria bacterium]